PGYQAYAGQPVLLLPLHGELVMRQAQPGRDPGGLGVVVPAPRLDQEDQVGSGRLQRLFQRGLPLFPVRAVAAPDVPRDHPNRRLDYGAVRGVRIEAHVAIMRGREPAEESVTAGPGDYPSITPPWPVRP